MKHEMYILQYQDIYENHNLLLHFISIAIFIVADAPLDAAEEAEDVSADVLR